MIADRSIEFFITPFKLALSLFIHLFLLHKSDFDPKEIGQVCLVMLKLIQGPEIEYNDLIKYYRKCNIDNDFITDYKVRIKFLVDEGIGAITDLIMQFKKHPYLNKSSVVGFFVRKMYLFFDKWDLMDVAKLYEKFKIYVGNKEDEEMQNNSESINIQLLNPLTQVSLIQINEKEALSPPKLVELLKKSQPQRRLNPMALKNQFKTQEEANNTYFLQYLNSLRVNEYPSALQFLIAYFDGCIDQDSRCWAILNLAILHIHFNHTKLAMEAIKECISTAQETNDEKCLEFAFLLIAKIIINQKHKTSQDENILRFLYHLQTKATKLDLYHLSAIAALHFEQLTGLGKNIEQDNEDTISADILAVKHSMPDILMMTYSCKAAYYATVGDAHLTALTSQALLHLNSVENIGDQIVHRVNENTCIALRNIALHIWCNLGHYSMARHLLVSMVSQLFPSYQTAINSIWKQALAEIEFEHHLYRDDWKSCLSFISNIRLYNEIEADIRLAQLNLRKKLKQEAMSLICSLDEKLDQTILSSYTRVRIILIKARIIHDFSLLFEALELAHKYHYGSLETDCLLELARLQYKFGQRSKSLELLRNIFLNVLVNSTRRQVAFANYLQALNYHHLGKLEIALSLNQAAINIYQQLEDKRFLKKCYRLNAFIYNDKKDFEKRNYYSLQSKKIIMSILRE